MTDRSYSRYNRPITYDITLVGVGIALGIALGLFIGLGISGILLGLGGI